MRAPVIASLFILLTSFPASAKLLNCGLYSKLDKLAGPAQAKAAEILKQLGEIRKKNGYDGPKDRYVVNPKHVNLRSGASSHLPDNAEALYRHAIPSVAQNGRVTWWARDKDGTYHRFQGSNGETHWNGSSKPVVSNSMTSEGISPREIPQFVKDRFDLQDKLDKLLDAR